MSVCPSTESLVRLGHDSLSGPRFDAIEAHVQGCPECQGVLERLAVDLSSGDRGVPARPGGPPSIPGFEIERELGRGGMGVVYQAWQPQLARRVALKVVGGGPGVGAEDRRRWLREAQAIVRVRHPNVLRLHEVGEQNGWLYLVLDLVPGGSLADRVAGPLTARVAAGLVADVAGAVEEVHRAGLLHLDIKPSNILLDGPPDGPWDRVTPMLTDFGIARASDDPGSTATGPLGPRGTPSYMAPEQVGGGRGEVGTAADVFALGATLYRLLTGRPPFQGASVVETLDLVRLSEPAAPRSLVPGLPRDLETIALTCLRKDPRRRYASALALSDDLRRWLGGFPIRARPTSRLEHVGRWCRRRPAVSILLAALALTAASSLVGLITLWRRAEGSLARAVENEEAASRMIRELVGVLSATVEAPEMLTSDRIEFSAHVMRSLAARMRRDPGLGESSLEAISRFVRPLARDLIRKGKLAESRGLLGDLLGLLDARRGPGADGGRIDSERVLTLLELANLGVQGGHLDEVLAEFHRAEEALEGVPLSPRRLGMMTSIQDVRRTVAGILGGRGLEGPRRRALEENIRMFDHLSEGSREDPAIRLLAALARADLAPDFGTVAGLLRPAIEAVEADGRLPVYFEDQVAVWITDGIEITPPAPSPDGGADPEAHADAILGRLGARLEAIGDPPTMLAAVARRVSSIAAGKGADHRRAGRLAEARRAAACLTIIASRLAERDPHEVEFHLLRSTAYEQEAKNAWKPRDVPAIEDRLRKALGEAREALRLDPGHVMARLKVAGLQDKLVGLVSESPASR